PLGDQHGAAPAPGLLRLHGGDRQGTGAGGGIRTAPLGLAVLHAERFSCPEPRESGRSGSFPYANGGGFAAGALSRSVRLPLRAGLVAPCTGRFGAGTAARAGGG